MNKYIQRGHGMRGKQFSITNDQDLLNMYSEYHGRKEIALWMKKCKARSAQSKSAAEKQNTSTDQEVCSAKQKDGGSRYQGHLANITEAETIVKDLEACHSENMYSAEQFRVWAHMIQMNKHTSYSDPPDKPFFVTQRANGVAHLQKHCLLQKEST